MTEREEEYQKLLAIPPHLRTDEEEKSIMAVQQKAQEVANKSRALHELMQKKSAELPCVQTCLPRADEQAGIMAIVERFKTTSLRLLRYAAIREENREPDKLAGKSPWEAVLDEAANNAGSIAEDVLQDAKTLTKWAEAHGVKAEGVIAFAKSFQRSDWPAMEEFIERVKMAAEGIETEIPGVEKNVTSSTQSSVTYNIHNYGQVGAIGDDHAARLERFQNAVGIVDRTGRAMEAHPSTYFGKGETAIRDHLISVLSTHFEHVCGERFNKTGKTDIFIEHQKIEVLVAECKIWSGKQGYLDAIGQLLSYLTWRDGMAAVFLFVKKKEIGPVLELVQSVTAEHPSFVEVLSKGQQGQYEFQLRQNQDSAQKVRLAVLCFHFPTTG